MRRGHYAAWSEGSSSGNGYVYEWIVSPNGSTWQITNATQFYFDGMNPVIFYKAAFGFLALYNTTICPKHGYRSRASSPYPNKRLL